MKKFKIVLCFGILAATLAACGNNNQGTNNMEAIEIIEPEIIEPEIIEEENIEAENIEIEAKNIEAEIVEPEIVESETIEPEVTQVENIEPESVEKVTLSFDLKLTENMDGSVHATYVISDVNGVEIQTIENDPNFTKVWFDLFSGNCCFFEDFNFDGNLDVCTINSGGYVNAYNNVYIWDTEKNQFIYSEDASDIANAEVNIEKEQIISISRDAGLPSYRLYEVKDGKIMLVAELLEETGQDGNIKNTETLFEIDQVTDITNLNQLDVIWEGYNIEIYN